ncbi:MAG: two-component system response regulator [Bacteroidetes bacterium GWF2_38_335]|nr:MAG: two-component system response regulator [Bacteroidetes bacterium GWF2_38_335]OFY77463.1 MAG: two-component system response regulator [Bacteroidetes bacterium RIFOXYA12_FULL_38_20]HBS87247.1 DNA-binding response regulator [Bacteroidales bacterium]
MKKARILYVEDDIHLSYVTKDNLEIQGYEIIFCEDGQSAFEVFKKETFDLCILDVMLPNMDGFTLAKKIREKDQEIPIIFLTAKSMKEDKITGLKIGADDYIIKPFSIEELILKIEIFLKRSRKTEYTEQEKEILKIGLYEFDYSNLSLKLNNQTERLTQKEADLLKLFAGHINSVLKRDEILKKIWGKDDYFLGRSLDVFISRLRKYLKDDPSINIENIHGVGFNMQIKST